MMSSLNQRCVGLFMIQYDTIPDSPAMMTLL